MIQACNEALKSSPISKSYSRYSQYTPSACWVVLNGHTLRLKRTTDLLSIVPYNYLVSGRSIARPSDALCETFLLQCTVESYLGACYGNYIDSWNCRIKWLLLLRVICAQILHKTFVV